MNNRTKLMALPHTEELKSKKQTPILVVDKTLIFSCGKKCVCGRGSGRILDDVILETDEPKMYVAKISEVKLLRQLLEPLTVQKISVFGNVAQTTTL
jgi:hypothetical protein